MLLARSLLCIFDRTVKAHLCLGALPALDESKTAMSKRGFIVPVLTLSVAAILLFAIKGYWTLWEGGSAEQKTDDAYMRADVTPLSTRISGTVRKVGVNDFEEVKPGQLLVQLDDDEYRAVSIAVASSLMLIRAEG